MSFAPGQGPEITIVATTDEDDGLSIGTIFDLFFFIGGFIYFIGGMLVRKYFRGAEGKEMIPHYEFWSDLPLLIRVNNYYFSE